MSFPRHVDFKDSGVAWLGQIPSHWSLPKIKHIASFTGGGTPSRDNLAFWGGPIPWVSPKDMKVQEICEAEESITDLGLLNSTASLVERGHVLMVVRSGILKHTIPVAINVVAVALNQDMKALRFDPQRCTSSFFSRWVQGLNDQLLLAWAKQGATVESIEHGYMAESIIPLPPLGEQVAIDRFLDNEILKIDDLVEEQRRLIELLKEKRQAVISQAVTKGLDPNVSRKDSGVEWLGKVPAHWEVRKVNSLSTKITNGYVGPTRDILVDEGVRYLQSLHIKGNRIKFDAPYFVAEAWSHKHKKSILETGDLLIVQTGDIGQAAVVPDEFAGCNCHALIIVSPLRDVVCGEYLGWVFNSDYGKHSLLAIQTGALHPHLNCGNVKDVFVPVPPKLEQLRIVEHCAEATSAFDELMSEAEVAVALLNERRAALISAAVTGKIDVRGLVLQPEAVAA